VLSLSGPEELGGRIVRELKRYLIRGALLLAPVLILSAVTLPRLGPWLVVQDPLVKSDAIIVLGGTMYERQLEAVDLYKENWAPRIYLFRELADWGELVLIERGIPYTTVVDVQLEAMLRLGVPRDAIEVLDRAGSTAEEAEYVRRLVTSKTLSRVIVVSSKQHTRRARLVLQRKLAGTGTDIVVRPSRYDRSNIERWWTDRATLRFTLFETQRLLGYWIGIAD
jgi:uncharacterized SAM-binding protein YcdF (DUF218 family)